MRSLSSECEPPVESLRGLAQEFLHLGIIDNLSEGGLTVGGLESLTAGIMDDRHGSGGKEPSQIHWR